MAQIEQGNPKHSLNRKDLQKIEAALGGAIRTWRERRGLSVSEAARRTAAHGVACDGSYLSRMERGRSAMPLRTFIALCRVLDITPGQIIEMEFPASPTLLDLMPKESVDKLNRLAVRDSRLVGMALFRAIQMIEEVAGLFETE